MSTRSSIPAWEISWTEEAGVLQSMRSNTLNNNKKQGDMLEGYCSSYTHTKKVDCWFHQGGRDGELMNTRSVSYREPSQMLCDDLEGWDGEGGSRGSPYTYRLIHVVVWQKPIQHYKEIILQLKKKKQKICFLSYSGWM